MPFFLFPFIQHTFFIFIKRCPSYIEPQNLTCVLKFHLMGLSDDRSTWLVNSDAEKTTHWTPGLNPSSVTPTVTKPRKFSESSVIPFTIHPERVNISSTVFTVFKARNNVEHGSVPLPMQTGTQSAASRPKGV